MTLSDLQGHSPIGAFTIVFFVQLYSSWRDFNNTGASRDPSAIIEHLVSEEYAFCGVLTLLILRLKGRLACTNPPAIIR